MTLTSSPSGAAEARSCIQLSQTLARFGTVSLERRPKTRSSAGWRYLATCDTSSVRINGSEAAVLHISLMSAKMLLLVKKCDGVWLKKQNQNKAKQK